jgi:hypothetical protein
VSEKLAAFITLYKEKAASDLDKAKDSVQKAEDRLAESEEQWEKVRAEAENLGIVDKFLSAFPEPGGSVNVTIGGVGANPDYTALFEYGDPLAGLVKDLTKLKNSKQRLENSNNNLSQAESLLEVEPEDYLNKLGSAIFSEMAGASSVGAESAPGLLDSIFESYDDYEETVGYELDSIEGPSGVKTSEQAYEALKERYESGSLTKKSEGAAEAAEQAIKEAEASPINEIEEGSEPLSETQSASPINVPEAPVESESVSSEVTGTSPELNQPLVSDQLDLIANVNIESESPVNVEEVESETAAESPLNVEEVESEPASVSSTTNMDFSTMSAEEIRNSFLSGDVFGSVKNEFSNVFGENTAVQSPVNEAVSEEKQEEPEEVPETEQSTSFSSVMNTDFSNMSAEEIRNSFQTGDVFGGIKNTFSNIFGERKSPESSEAGEAASETTERKGFLSNIFARGREKKAEETVERGATTMNAPIISNTNAPVTQETSNTNIATNQQVETPAQAAPVSNQTSNVSNVSNDNSDQSMSESVSSNRSSMMQSGSDNSDIVNRLRRLERLLSGPLEVKIVES